MNALQSILTPITHHIPFFLREPAEALIGEQCYTSLVYNVHLTDVECLKYALSKGLGLGIVLGGAIVKIPQIVKIVQTRSARGLSLTAFILETTSYAVCLAYASRNKFPFSTYGENFFLTLQNVIITLLILYFSGSRATNSSGLDGKKPLSRGEGGNVKRVIAGAATAAIGGLTLWSPSLTPLPLLGVLQAITLPISLLSKAPQIMSNHKAKSTGNLSAFAVFNALLGCLARLFTTKQEVNDPLIFWGFAGAALLNLVLAGQMVTYWNNGEESPVSTRRKPSVVTEAKQAAGAEESGSGRRWARKLD